jgi:D-glycero-alpha-D-manno-heptose-7-phosphate kinase
MKEGARAGKVSGAGGGGFMMFIVDPAKRPQVIKCLSGFSPSISTCMFVEHGAHSWRVT